MDAFPISFAYFVTPSKLESGLEAHSILSYLNSSISHNYCDNHYRSQTLTLFVRAPTYHNGEACSWKQVKEDSAYTKKKLDLKALEKELSQRVVGEKLGVAMCTVTDIWKQTDAIASSESQAFSNKKPCVIHPPKQGCGYYGCWQELPLARVPLQKQCFL